MLRMWVIDAERSKPALDSFHPVLALQSNDERATPSFIPLQLSSSSMQADVRVEVQRGDTVIKVHWPESSAAECAAWLRELLR